MSAKGTGYDIISAGTLGGWALQAPEGQGQAAGGHISYKQPKETDEGCQQPALYKDQGGE